MRVLVVGGTGLIGRGVVRGLRDDGHDVVVGTRRAPTVRGDVDLVRVDLEDVDSLRAATGTVDAVVAAMPLSDGSRRGFVAERDGTRNLLAALEARPRMPIVKLSEIGADQPGGFFDLQCKHQAEEMVRGSGHPYLVLRPPWVMEAWPALLTTPAGVLVPTGRANPVHWVSTRDLGAWTAAAFARWDRVEGATLTAQGPEGLTFAEAGTRYARRAGRRTVPFPLQALRAGALLSPRLRTLWELFDFYGRSDQGPRSQEIHELLGAPTVTFDGFLDELAVPA